MPRLSLVMVLLALCTFGVAWAHQVGKRSFNDSTSCMAILEQACSNCLNNATASTVFDRLTCFSDCITTNKDSLAASCEQIISNGHHKFPPFNQTLPPDHGNGDQNQTNPNWPGFNHTLPIPEDKNHTWPEPLSDFNFTFPPRNENQTDPWGFVNKHDENNETNNGGGFQKKPTGHGWLRRALRKLGGSGGGDDNYNDEYEATTKYEDNNSPNTGDD